MGALWHAIHDSGGGPTESKDAREVTGLSSLPLFIFDAHRLPPTVSTDLLLYWLH
jgi:hypothetical protein